MLRVGGDPAFLLLRDGARWDVPKGKDKRGESELQCAMRELFEETRLAPEHVTLDETFRFEAVWRKRNRAGEIIEKTLVMFLAMVEDDARVRCDDHDGFAWVRYEPGRIVDDATIDPLLRAVDEHVNPHVGVAPRRKHAG